MSAMASKIVEERRANRIAAGQRVAACRTKLGLTQTALGQEAALPQSTIGNIEVGARGMTPEQRVAIANALGVDPPSLDPAATPELSPADVAASANGKQAGSLNRVSVQDRSVSSVESSLEAFLERHPEAARKKRVRWYVENTGFKLEPWVELDDRFWVAQFRFWEQYLAEVDAESGEEGPRPPRKSHR
jgi:transcriptional regulator with XRE-family HTH domain